MISFLQGDVFDNIKKLEDNSIDCVVTSPPYWGLRNYNVDGQLGLEPTYQEHIQNIVELFRVMKPKLKDTATIWLNYGDSYSSGKRTSTTNQTLRGNKNYGVTRTPVQEGIKEKDLIMIPNRIAIALQDDGWYIRSEIIWHKPNPMPESVRDRPTSAHEKIWLITKSKKYYYDSDAIREPLASTSLTRLNQPNLKNQKGSTRANGGMKTNGNMKAVRPYRVLDADQRPEFVETRDLPEHDKVREYLSLNRKNKNITIDEIEKHFGNQAGHHWFEKNGSYPSKDDWLKLKKLLGFDDTYDKQLTTINIKSGLKQNHPLGRNKRNVWTITTKPCKEAHFATFPKDLIEPCIKAGCPEKVCIKCGKPQVKELYRDVKTKEVHRNVRDGDGDRAIGGQYTKWMAENPYKIKIKPSCDCNADFKPGVVFDPFGGSGTTGIVAKLFNRKSILSELNPEYIKIAKARINKEFGMFE